MRGLQVLALVAFASLFACETDSRDLTAPQSPRLPSGPMASIGIDPVSGATIETDQDDYVPGQLVHVTGHGWGVAETVHLFMTEDPDTHGDVTQDIQADSSGAFSVPFYDVQDHDLGVTFTLTATGQTSGDSATTVFTDSRTVNSFTMNSTTFTFPPPPPSNPPASNPITVATGSSVTVVANATTTGTADQSGSNSSLWLSTSVEVKPTSGSFTQILCDEADVNTGGAGTFTYTFSFTAPAAGTYDVRVRAWAANGCSSNSGDRTYLGSMIVTGKANQTISFGALGGKTYGDAAFAVNATATSGLPVSFSSTTPATCSVASNTVSILAAGSCTVRASQGGNTNYNPAPDVDQSFTIGRAAVTAMAGSGSGTYNGAPQSPTACAVSGPFTGDLSCANSPATVGPNAGTTTISPLMSGTGLGNFTITVLNGSYTISQAHVTATAGSGSGTYNGSTQSPSPCAVTGAYTGDLTCSDLPGVVGPTAGTTTITPGVTGTGLTNFDINLVNGSYTIAKAPVTATAGGGSGTYNGSQQSPSGCVMSGLYTGDLTCANNPIVVGPGVGTTSISPNVSGTGLANFDITPVAGSYTIARASVTATAGSGSATYNGLTHAPSACGVTGNYTGNLFCTNDPSTVGPDVGTVVINPAVSGQDLGNFDITAVAGSYEIQKAPVTATAGSGSSTYDGNPHAPAACAVTGIYIGGLSCANDPASVGPDVGTFAINPVVNGSGQSNFDITVAGGSYEIKKAPVTAKAGSGSGTYNGVTQSPSACAVTGTYTGDLSCANSPAAVGPDVGTTPIGPVVSGTGLNNFDIASVAGSYTINQAPVIATAGSGSSTYDGGAHAAAACVVAPAVLGGYTGDLSCANDPASVGPNAGTFGISAVVTGTGLGNFAIATVNGSYTIDKAPTATAVTCPVGPYTYNGSAQTPCTAGATGAGGLSQALDLSYTDNINAGTATASASFAGDDNHYGSNGSAAFTIDKASSTTTVTCPAGPYTYNGSAQTPCSASVSGAGALSQSLSVGYANNTNAGTATANASFAGDANHYGSNGSATFTIDKTSSTTTVTCPAGPYTYNGSAQIPCSAAVSGAGGLSQALAVSYADNTNAGTATASASFAGDGNHYGSSGAATFTIGKAPSTTTVTCPASVSYTGSAQTPCSASVTGAGGLSQNLTVSYANNIVGTATANATYGGDGNHYGSSDSRTFTILYASTGMCFGDAGHAILQPINADGTSVFKQGSTVPAKFRVCDANGNSIGTAGVVSNFRQVQVVSGTVVSTVDEAVVSTTPDAAFRWSATDQQWIFNMNTKALNANKTYFYEITLNDGSKISFKFGLK